MFFFFCTWNSSFSSLSFILFFFCSACFENRPVSYCKYRKVMQKSEKVKGRLFGNYTMLAKKPTTSDRPPITARETWLFHEVKALIENSWNFVVQFYFLLIFCFSFLKKSNWYEQNLSCKWVGSWHKSQNSWKSNWAPKFQLMSNKLSGFFFANFAWHFEQKKNTFDLDRCWEVTTKPKKYRYVQLC